MVVFNGTPYSYVKNLQGDIVALLDTTPARRLFPTPTTLGASPLAKPAPWHARWVRSIPSATAPMSTTKRPDCIISEAGTITQFGAGLRMQIPISVEVIVVFLTIFLHTASIILLLVWIPMA